MSKLFSAEDKEGGVERWELPDVNPHDNDSGYSRLLTAAQIEKIQKQAYDEGFKQGHQAGYKAGEAELIQAAQQAQLHNFIRTLPQGYDTWIGEQGLRLSGGQVTRPKSAMTRAMSSSRSVIPKL